MRTPCLFTSGRLILISALVCLAALATAPPVAAQTPQGATLTVVSGEVAVSQASGSAVQPAGSGMTLRVGDQVATVGRSTALVTFFEGSELELGDRTTIIIREVVASGTEVHVTVEDVLGTTFGRVTAFVNPNSSFEIQSPGGKVVALIRGSEARMTVLESGAVNAAVAECTRICEIIVEGVSVFSGTGEAAFGIDQAGGLHEGTVPDVSVPGTSGSTSPGGATGGTPGGSDDTGSKDEPAGDDEEEDGDSGYGYRGWTPLLAEKLRQRLDSQADPVTATGAMLALGMVGWSVIGRRRP